MCVCMCVRECACVCVVHRGALWCRSMPGAWPANARSLWPSSTPSSPPSLHHSSPTSEAPATLAPCATRIAPATLRPRCHFPPGVLRAPVPMVLHGIMSFCKPRRARPRRPCANAANAAIGRMCHPVPAAGNQANGTSRYGPADGFSLPRPAACHGSPRTREKRARLPCRERTAEAQVAAWAPRPLRREELDSGQIAVTLGRRPGTMRVAVAPGDRKAQALAAGAAHQDKRGR